MGILGAVQPRYANLRKALLLAAALVAAASLFFALRGGEPGLWLTFAGMVLLIVAEVLIRVADRRGARPASDD